ncbi:helix-turn-helix domain-containing protein [Streptomyces sp. Caat 7-52]|uniref:helix-turn-helix domain-containing protein n=1 Tax=Streptomyces sp. Caat 7-52 TaxID=2949637 RepID=UPI002034B6D3|nr:helix-turn-helix domain-containing protein [Streptomyces sp. Caat 7-52]
MTPRRGRPIQPVPDPKHGPGRLAEELRRGRRQRRLTRPELAQKIDRSIATVQRAEAGHVRPPWPVVQGIAEACRLDLATVEVLWKEASAPAPDRVDAPHLKLVHTPADLAAALRRAWLENGEPSVRQMERRAEARASEFTPLSRMSAWGIRERKQPIASLRQLHAYLAAWCPGRSLPRLDESLDPYPPARGSRSQWQRGQPGHRRHRTRLFGRLRGEATPRWPRPHLRQRPGHVVTCHRPRSFRRAASPLLSCNLARMATLIAPSGSSAA